MLLISADVLFWIHIVLLVAAVPSVYLLMDESFDGTAVRRFARAWVIVAAAAWLNFGSFHGGRFSHAWEAYHHFLGARYFSELGYDGIYVASHQAQKEMKPFLHQAIYVRDLRSNQVGPVYLMRDHIQDVKSRFTPERWRSFSQDNIYFVDSVSTEYLRKMRLDHGNNASPAWMFLARALAAWLPASDAALAYVGALDLVLLAILFGFIWSTFGWRFGSVAAILFGLGYPWSFFWIGGAFLRLDWFVALGMAVCMIRRENWHWAGAFLGASICLRLFPLVFIGPIALVAIRHIVQKQDLSWARQFGRGLGWALVIGFVAGSLAGRGPGAWLEWLQNITLHGSSWLTNNVGVRNLPLYGPETWYQQVIDRSSPAPWEPWFKYMAELQAQRWPAVLAAVLFAAGLTTVAIWQLPVLQAFVMGIGLVFSVALLTSYYWCILVFAPLKGGRIVAAAVAALNVPLLILDQQSGTVFERIYGLMSWLLLVLLVAWVLPDIRRAVVRWRGNETGEATG